MFIRALKEEHVANQLIKQPVSFALQTMDMWLGSDVFGSQGKRNLSIKICRDIDGDVLSDLTAERCLEKEYRSQITINYGTVAAYDEDLDAFTIDLWYYYGGFKGRNW